MFFQNKSEQKLSEDLLGIEPLNGRQSGIAVDEDQVPKFYQKDELFTQGSQTIAAISQNSVFHGDVETKDNLAIFGRLEGNIAGAASVRICGEVKGQIRCEDFLATEGTVEGDVFAIGSAEISESSRLAGNLHCTRAVVSGTISGNIDAAQSILLTETAVLNGDLCTAQLEIRKGAKLNGAVRTASSPVSPSHTQEEPLEESREPVPEPVL